MIKERRKKTVITGVREIMDDIGGGNV